MGIHQIFSQNLRNKCVRFGSIAEACNQIAVNRQQFNKYLSGAMLPNARTLNRICLVLDIQDWELFVPANANGTNRATSHSEHVSENAALLSNFVLSAPAETLLNSNMEPNFDIGFYNCYFPVPNFRGFAVRSRVTNIQIDFAV